MKLIELFSCDATALDVKAKDKDAVINKLVDLQFTHGNITDKEAYKKAIYAREAEFSTYVGEGIAVPHAKTDVVTAPSLAVVRLAEPIQYNEDDDDKSRLFFMIAAPMNGNLHVDMLARMMSLLANEEFVAKLNAAKTPQEFLDLIAKEEEQNFGNESFTEEEVPQAGYRILCVTACPTGIAHTFMAKEALEKAAAERGLTIKVETHGQVGVENELTKGEIAGAKAVVVAADKDVQAERFAGKPMVSVGVSKALSVEAAGKLIDRALAAKGDDTVAAAADVEDEVEEKESIGHVIYKHLMNGVSHMLVFVVAGGVLTAVSFLWGITSFDSTASDYNTFAAMLKIVGGIAMNLMVPVLSAYIAESIGKRPALVPGFVAGMIAIQGLPVVETPDGAMLIDAGGTGVGFGFLGGIVGGVHTVVDDLMPHRLYDLTQGGFDQAVLGSLAVFVDQCDFHR